MIISETVILYLDWLLLLTLAISFCQQLFSEKFNFYGISALLSLSTYIALHSITSEINIFVFLLFIGAALLIVLEMFIPGGIMGTLGIITIVTSMIMVNKETQIISFIILTSFAVFVACYLFNVYVLKNKLVFFKGLILDEELSTEKGYVAKESEINLLGMELVTITDLRPAGVAESNNKRYDVVSNGDFIDKGNKVVVTHVEGMRIVVSKK